MHKNRTRVGQNEFKMKEGDLTEKIIGSAYRLHNKMGFG
jgi:hypothetical protein